MLKQLQYIVNSLSGIIFKNISSNIENLLIPQIIDNHIFTNHLYTIKVLINWTPCSKEKQIGLFCKYCQLIVMSSRWSQWLINSTIVLIQSYLTFLFAYFILDVFKKLNNHSALFYKIQIIKKRINIFYSYHNKSKVRQKKK